MIAMKPSTRAGGFLRRWQGGRCRTIRNGSIAVAGTQVGSTPSVSREVFLSHTSRCGVQFSSARGGGLSVDRDETVDAGGRRRRPPQAGSVANGSVAGGSVANGSVANGGRSRRRSRPQAVAAGRRRPPQAAVHVFFCVRMGCVKVKHSGATRARSLCFI